MDELKDSLKKLRTDYVDMFLIHWPTALQVRVDSNVITVTYIYTCIMFEYITCIMVVCNEVNTQILIKSSAYCKVVRFCFNCIDFSTNTSGQWSINTKRIDDAS